MSATPPLAVTTDVCCAPIGQVSADPEANAIEIATRLKALADPSRVRIVQYLACCEDHEITTTDAAKLLGVSVRTLFYKIEKLGMR